MAGVGFYEIGASRIVFGRDGQWYADGERITNRRIALLFSRHLVALPDGTYQLAVGDEKASVEVEDTPWVVTAVDGDSDSGFLITLNDQSQEALDPQTLVIEADHSLSCSVKGGSARARFLRPAHNTLSSHACPAGEPGSFVIAVAGQRYPITARAGTPGAD